MELTPEEREQIYRQEKARREGPGTVLGRDHDDWAAAQEVRARVMRTHVKILGVMYVVTGAFAGIVLLAGFEGLAEMDQMIEAFPDGAVDPQASQALSLMQSVIAGWFKLWLVLTCANVIAGVGLLRFKSWAYSLSLVLSCIALLNLPLGTIIGIYGLWVLLSRGTSSLFVRQNT